MDKTEFKFIDFLKKYLLWILIIPIVSISALSCIIKFGTNLINTSEIAIDLDTPVKLGEYLYYYISIVAIEVTGLLSYAIWKTSVKSNELSNEIVKKEELRDKEIIRESALIVYYDLITNINILRKQYIKYIRKGDLIEVNKPMISIDWVKNTANLRAFLNDTELETVFNLYNSFALMNEFEYESSERDDNFVKLIERLAIKLFQPVLLDYLWLNFNGITMSILNNKYYPILRKIEMATKIDFDMKSYSENDGKENIEIKQKNNAIKYKGTFVDGILVNGTDSWYREDGSIMYSFKIKDNYIISGTFISRFRDENELIFDCDFDKEYNQQNGFSTQFYKPNKIKYQGYIKNSEFDGEGVKYRKHYSSSPLFKGIWKENERIEGEYINKSSNKIKYFKGNFKNDKPFTGYIETGLVYELKGIYGFKGEIVNGIPINGKGYVHNKNHVDDEYKRKNPWWDAEDEEIHDNYPDDVCDEDKQEIIEDSIRWDKRNEFDRLKEDYGFVIELIGATWKNGKCTRFKDDILNKEFLFRNDSKKEKIKGNNSKVT